MKEKTEDTITVEKTASEKKEAEMMMALVGMLQRQNLLLNTLNRLLVGLQTPKGRNAELEKDTIH